MTSTQTRLNADAFGESLRNRVDRATELHGQAIALETRLREETGEAWQPAAPLEAQHHAIQAIENADSSCYHQRLANAGESVEAGQWLVEQILKE